MKIETPRSMSELRAGLCEVFARVQQDSAFVTMAHEATNAAGKIIKSIAVELEYHQLTGDKSAKCPFLDKD